MQVTQKLKKREDILLEKVGNRIITVDEVIELGKLLEENAKIRKMDEGTRTLIMLGLTALGGYLLGKASR